MKKRPNVSTYFGSLIDGGLKSRLFSNVGYYCMFFGYPGSGHSLVGSLMDAHPNMIISHELDALDYLRRGYGQNQIFSLIMRRSEEFTQEGREWTGHKYQVSGQWQGGFDKDLIVIGDKKGGWASRDIFADQTLLPRLSRKIKKLIRYLHVTRNPYDNISTMTRRSGRTLEESAKIYFERAEGVRIAKSLTHSKDWFDIQHEQVVAKPKETLQEICNWFGLESSKEYLNACAVLVFPSPNKSREKQPWDANMIISVAEEIKQYEFLSAYSFED